MSRQTLTPILLCLLTLGALPGVAAAQQGPTFPDPTQDGWSYGDDADPGFDPDWVDHHPQAPQLPQAPVAPPAAPVTPVVPVTPQAPPLVTTGTVAGKVARMRTDGRAAIPRRAPRAVRAIIAAANQIIGKPYKWGGGHAKLLDRGYDCSGTVSYALIGAGLLEDDTPLDSSRFMRWGDAGPGTWFTVYTNPGHAFAVIAGLRLDTSAAGDPSGLHGPRWRPTLRSTRGFRARHPEGF